MARPRAQGEKELFWIASSYRELLAFPERVKDRIGTALGVAQFGGKHVSAKPWKGEGPGVLEVVEDHAGDTYRAVYTVRSRKQCTFCTRSRRSLPRGQDGQNGYRTGAQAAASSQGTSSGELRSEMAYARQQR